MLGKFILVTRPIRTGLTIVGVASVSLFVTTGSRAADQPSTSINAAQIASAGNGHGAPACATCHGSAGEGNALIGVPRMGGYSPAYLDRQLEDFADGKRANAVMTPIAEALSQTERAAVAAFYARLSNNHVKTADPTVAADSSTPSLGEQLALRGRWSNELPACIQCHGNGGVGVGDAFPALAGQPALYLENQLHAWQSGSRDPGPLGLMRSIANKLSAADIQAVAEYFSGRPIPNGGYHR
jgi:cytochrome c553